MGVINLADFRGTSVTPIMRDCLHCQTPFPVVRKYGVGRKLYCGDVCRKAALAARTPVLEEVRRQWQREYWKTPEAKAARKKFVEANKESLREYRRKHYAENKAKYLAKAAKWQKENPEAKKDAQKKFARTPRGKEISFETVHRRRARRMKAGGSFSKKQFQDMCWAYDYKCLCCGGVFPQAKLEPDHVVPISVGGHNGIGNIQPLFAPCNRRKSDKIIDYRPRVSAAA